MKTCFPMILAALCLATFLTSGAVAADSKIATIHLQRVVDEYYKGKAAAEQLKKAVEAYQSKLKKLGTEFETRKKALDQLADEINSGVLSNKKKKEKLEQAEKLQKELIELDKQRRQMMVENEDALAKQDVQAYKAVVDDILKHLETKLQKEKYDFVIKMTDTSEDRPFIREGAIVAVGTNAIDITNEVIKEMNAKEGK